MPVESRSSIPRAKFVVVRQRPVPPVVAGGDVFVEVLHGRHHANPVNRPEQAGGTVVQGVGLFREEFDRGNVHFREVEASVIVDHDHGIRQQLVHERGQVAQLPVQAVEPETADLSLVPCGHLTHERPQTRAVAFRCSQAFADPGPALGIPVAHAARHIEDDFHARPSPFGQQRADVVARRDMDETGNLGRIHHGPAVAGMDHGEGDVPGPDAAARRARVRAGTGSRTSAARPRPHTPACTDDRIPVPGRRGAPRNCARPVVRLRSGPRGSACRSRPDRWRKERRWHTPMRQVSVTPPGSGQLMLRTYSGPSGEFLRYSATAAVPCGRNVSWRSSLPTRIVAPHPPP